VFDEHAFCHTNCTKRLFAKCDGARSGTKWSEATFVCNTATCIGLARSYTRMYGQNHIYIYIYGVYIYLCMYDVDTVLLAGESLNTRSCTVYVYMALANPMHVCEHSCRHECLHLTAGKNSATLAMNTASFLPLTSHSHYSCVYVFYVCVCVCVCVCVFPFYWQSLARDSFD